MSAIIIITMNRLKLGDCFVWIIKFRKVKVSYLYIMIKYYELAKRMPTPKCDICMNSSMWMWEVIVTRDFMFADDMLCKSKSNWQTMVWMKNMRKPQRKCRTKYYVHVNALYSYVCVCNAQYIRGSNSAFNSQINEHH